jgi:hypothetical protein
MNTVSVTEPQTSRNYKTLAESEAYRGYTQYDIKDDAAGFEPWVQTGHWFLEADTGDVYRIADANRDQLTVALAKGHIQYPYTQTGTQSSGTDITSYVETICDLAGAIRAGTVIPIPRDSSRKIGDHVVVTDTDTQTLTVYPNSAESEWIDSMESDPTPINERYHGTYPSAFENRVDPAEDSTPLVFGTDDISLDAHPDISSPQTTISPPAPQIDATQTASVTGDGGIETNRSDPPEQTVPTTAPTFDASCDGIRTQMVDVGVLTAATFESKPLREYIEWYGQGPRILNATAGPTRLNESFPDAEIVRNDIRPEIESDYTVDIVELAKKLPPNSFNTAILDPPWSLYQSNLRYQGAHVHKTLDIDGMPKTKIRIDVRDLPYEVAGEADRSEAHKETSQQTTLTGQEYSDDNGNAKQQVGHGKLAKRTLDYLLKPGGVVIQMDYNGTLMPNDLGYERVDRTIFDPYGLNKPVIGAVDVKNRRSN